MYHAEVRTSRLDASYGCILDYQAKEFSTIPPASSGFNSQGDARDICILKTGNNQQLVIVSNNNEALNIFKISN